jgi:hypothetical protein
MSRPMAASADPSGGSAGCSDGADARLEGRACAADVRGFFAAGAPFGVARSVAGFVIDGSPLNALNLAEGRSVPFPRPQM